MECEICGHSLRTEREVIQITSGAIRVGKKSRNLVFIEDKDPEIVEVHFDCLLGVLDYPMDHDNRADMDECGVCKADLIGYVAHRLVLGAMNLDGFVPFESDENIALICDECLEAALEENS